LDLGICGGTDGPAPQLDSLKDGFLFAVFCFRLKEMQPKGWGMKTEDGKWEKGTTHAR
jgi:hypothetical protein